jgi:hypothetical protein
VKYGIWVHIENPRPKTTMLAAEADGWMLGCDGKVLVFETQAMAEEQAYVIRKCRPDSRHTYSVKPISDKEIAKENEGLR